VLQQAEVTAGNNAGSRLYLWLVFALLIGLMMSNYLSRQVVTVLFPFLKAEWGCCRCRFRCWWIAMDGYSA